MTGLLPRDGRLLATRALFLKRCVSASGVYNDRPPVYTEGSGGYAICESHIAELDDIGVLQVLQNLAVALAHEAKTEILFDNTSYQYISAEAQAAIFADPGFSNAFMPDGPSDWIATEMGIPVPE